MDKVKYKKLFFEFLRYVLVGGIAFLADWGTLFLTREFVFRSGSELDLFICTIIAFLVGLAVNYLLSIVFVFKKGDNKSDGKSVKSFIIFAIIGVIGLGLTELGMYTGVFLLSLHYMLTKIVVAGLVLVWNYIGRKIFVFNK